MSGDKIKWKGKMLWMGFIHQIDGWKKNTKKLYCVFCLLFILINHEVPIHYNNILFSKPTISYTPIVNAI